MVKMLKQSGPKIDPGSKNGKADKCDKMVIWANWKTVNPTGAREMFKMLKQAAPQIDTIGKNRKPNKLAKTVQSVKW